MLPLGAGAQVPLGTEFQVNTRTLFSQQRPSVASSADGGFVVVWASSYQDGASDGVFARLFSSAGLPLASEFQVNTYTSGDQDSPSVAAGADGDFVVVWQSSPQDGSYGGIFARRFSSGGAPLIGEVQINTYTTGFQGGSVVSVDADGDFVVAWESAGQDNPPFLNSGVFFRRFSSAGTALTSELQVNVYTSGNQGYLSLAAEGDGDFVVAWQSHLQDGSVEGVFARQFSSAGAALAKEFQVNTYTTKFQGDPSVATSADGDFVIAWSSYQGGITNGIFARRFSSSGAPIAGEFQVDVYTVVDQYKPSVAAFGDGGFVVAWTDFTKDGSVTGVSARRFTSAGAPSTGELQVNTYTANHQRDPVVGVDGDGRFVIAWRSFGQDGSMDGVFAQRFTPPSTLDIDANGSTEALTDGLLILRRMSGLSGPALTNGAVGAGCTRCDAEAIEPYIAGLGLTLDVDGNTIIDPLTDGLLPLRFLFGFTGSTLTDGAVDTQNCQRCDADAIEPYLTNLSN